ncbi:DUF6292 family protein [Sciscionella sediminilitoris]|uniref:DUF6292 family protein n=1 Tax=Sciscionella sediminilitoris TaxID=1445613 RepID=UPI00056AC93D|nr:DUF6292 family protein [Sciscionella sp. SE31]
MSRYLTGDYDAPISTLEAALHNYIAQIAAALGVGTEATLCELSDWASAYIALSERCPAHPGQDLALLWDQQYGWALALEPYPGGALSILTYYGRSLIPTPDELLTFVTTQLDELDQPGPAPVAPHFADTELVDSLAPYAIDE